MAYLDVYIIGLGNLGTAFLEGLNSNNNLNLHLYEENDDIRENYSKKFNLSIFKNFEKIDSGVLILCIKPQGINSFLKQTSTQINKDVLICSPIAGLTISSISKYLNNKIIRIMPNLLIKKNNGFIPFVKNYEGDYINFELEVLSFLGNIKEFDEDLFPLITSLSGSGPAWYYELSQQLIEAGSDQGMNEKDAELLIKELIKSLPDLINDEDTFSDLVNKIKSPKGITEAGLDSLIDDSFQIIIKKAIQKATQRSLDISSELENE